MDDFNFSYPDQGTRHRQAFRAALPGLEARLASAESILPVKDISATGMALVDAQAILGQGREFECDLLLNKKPLIHGLKARVSRLLPDGLAGCSFFDLSPRKEAALDKLVLEVQKRLIALKKAETQKE